MNLRNSLKNEDAEQIAVMEWCGYRQKVHPELTLLHHIPNGGSRNSKEAAKLKQMGVKPGVADLHLPVPKGIYSGLYIEMKCGSGRLENSQKQFLLNAAHFGNFCVVCYDADSAIGIIEEYVRLQIDPGRWASCKMKIPNASVIRDGNVTPIPQPK